MTELGIDADVMASWFHKLPPNPFGPQFTQLAVYCRKQSTLEFVVNHARALGYDEWVPDLARHYGLVGYADKPWFEPKPTAIDAHMAFNYQIIPGVEFELMYWEHVRENPRYQHPFEIDPDVPVMTYRVECTWAEEKRMLERYDLRWVYRFGTVSHENPNVFGRARYRDTMWNTYNLLGYNIRACARIPWEPYFVVPRGSGVELNPAWFGHDISDSKMFDGKWYRQGWFPTGG